jgi:hypothetical protein
MALSELHPVNEVTIQAFSRSIGASPEAPEAYVVPGCSRPNRPIVTCYYSEHWRGIAAGPPSLIQNNSGRPQGLASRCEAS